MAIHTFKNTSMCDSFFIRNGCEDNNVCFGSKSQSYNRKLESLSFESPRML